MKKLLLQYWVLILILLLAATLRFWNLSNNPPSLNWDEVSLGYNAYSIFTTGRDEYGTLLPLNLKSFGDYKPAFYAYLDIPFIALLGLNELAVRLPSSLAGITLVAIVYFLIIELLKTSELPKVKIKYQIKYLGLSVAFMLAISPLSIQFSRSAIEANIALFLIASGALFFLKGLTKTFYFLFAAIFLGLSLFTYQASRLFVPLLIIGLLVIYQKKIQYDKWLKAGLLMIFALGIILGYLMIGLGQSQRLEAMNLFAYRRSDEQIKLIADEDRLNINSLPFQILHGEWWMHLRGVAERYLIYLSPKMLFISGDYDPRHRVPDLGVFYYFSLVLIPLGFIYLWRNRPVFNLVFWWLATATIPAVLSRDLISMIRALNLLLPYSILEGAGLFFVISQIWLKRRLIFYPALGLLIVVISVNLLIFLDRYFIHAPQEYSQGWVYGYREVFQFIDNPKELNKYQHVVISDFYGQPYIYFLFYLRYLPSDFQKQAVLDQPTVDVGTVRQIGNVAFRHVYWPTDRNLKNSLFVGTLEELPDKDILPYPEFKIIKEVKFLDGLPAFRVVTTD